MILFPGSFDPFTIGHASLVRRALTLFDSVVIAIGINEGKQCWMPAEERVAKLRALYKDEPRVKVIAYTGLTTDCATRCGAKAILRGVRSMKDYEYELQMADINRRLSGIETVVLFTEPELASISSSMVRELALFGQDITPFIPDQNQPPTPSRQGGERAEG